jgi:hypothetical protein
MTAHKDMNWNRCGCSKPHAANLLPNRTFRRKLNARDITKALEQITSDAEDEHEDNGGGDVSENTKTGKNDVETGMNSRNTIPESDCE